MMNENLGVVPFGKYRGRPRSELLTGRGYCEWLSTQPWVAERYPDLHRAVEEARADRFHPWVNKSAEGGHALSPFMLGQLDAQREVPSLPLYDSAEDADEYMAGWNLAETGKPAPNALRPRPRRRWFRR